MVIAMLTPITNSGINFEIDTENPEAALALMEMCKRLLNFVCTFKRINIPDEDDISNRTCHRILISLNYAIEDIKTTKNRDYLKEIRQLSRKESQFQYLFDVLATAKTLAIPDIGVLRGTSTGSCVYGEVSSHQMRSFVRELRIGAGDIFMDLGSGYGQLCCLVSAYAGVKKSIGIEILKNLHDAGVKHKNEFERLMKYFGKEHKEIELIHGDMTDFEDKIKTEPTVIFVNNYKFDPMLTHKLKKIFMGCEDGTRIISPIPLVTADEYSKFHHWKAESLVPMTYSRRLKIVPENVSWCHNKPCEFTLTTINRNRAPFSR
ncbi:unnamed protein product [Caenorhabditis brenneri]